MRPVERRPDLRRTTTSSSPGSRGLSVMARPGASFQVPGIGAGAALKFDSLMVLLQLTISALNDRRSGAWQSNENAVSY